MLGGLFSILADLVGILVIALIALGGFLLVRRRIGLSGRRNLSDTEQLELSDRLLGQDEHLVAALPAGRGCIFLTDSRILFQEVEGIFGQDHSLTSYDYDEILSFEVSSSGIVTKIAILSMEIQTPKVTTNAFGQQSREILTVTKRIKGHVDVYSLQQILSEKIS